MNHKSIETKHPDGRQDVTIQINRLDIKDRTPEDTEAEAKIIDAMSNTKVGVLVIYKYNNDNIYFTCALPNVRKNAEMVIEKYRKENMHLDVRVEDFIIVESAVVTNKPKVTTL